MRNLEQIRAAAALAAAQSQSQSLKKSAVSKLPALILNNGLLATAAFCLEGGDTHRGGMKTALEATAGHLASRGIIPTNNTALREFIEYLSNRNSHELRRATSEALAFIGYLKRFAKGD
jgi:CRISPR type III-B/RAMP module-associated protein Cmr5